MEQGPVNGARHPALGITSPQIPNTKVMGVSSPHVHAVWHMAAPYLEAAVARDFKVSIEDIKQKCEDADMQLWLCWRDILEPEVTGALVTEIYESPQAVVLSLAFCGGADLKYWLHWIGGIEEWGRSVGCTHVEIPGRKGWGRVLPEYTEQHRVFVKEISDGE